MNWNLKILVQTQVNLPCVGMSIMARKTQNVSPFIVSARYRFHWGHGEEYRGCNWITPRQGRTCCLSSKATERQQMSQELSHFCGLTTQLADRARIVRPGARIWSREVDQPADPLSLSRAFWFISQLLNRKYTLFGGGSAQKTRAGHFGDNSTWQVNKGGGSPWSEQQSWLNPFSCLTRWSPERIKKSSWVSGIFRPAEASLAAPLPHVEQNISCPESACG